MFENACEFGAIGRAAVAVTLLTHVQRLEVPARTMSFSESKAKATTLKETATAELPAVDARRSPRTWPRFPQSGVYLIHNTRPKHVDPLAYIAVAGTPPRQPLPQRPPGKTGKSPPPSRRPLTLPAPPLELPLPATPPLQSPTTPTPSRRTKRPPALSAPAPVAKQRSASPAPAPAGCLQTAIARCCGGWLCSVQGTCACPCLS